MGTWDYKISDSDTYQDIYQNFFDLYNQGYSASEASKKIQEDFTDLFNDDDDRNDSLFALAYAQWETKALAPINFKQVKDIIESKKDIKVWQHLGADATTLEKRKTELEKFLSQISIEKEKAKRRVRAKFDFKEVNLLTLQSPDLKRTFTIGESYINGIYHDTHGLMNWPGAGSGVFAYYEQGKFITAHWANAQTLEIKHDKTINFSQKEVRFYLSGDQGEIIYIPE